MDEHSHTTNTPGSQLPRAPRQIPAGLSGKVTRWFFGWGILGLLSAGILFVIGWSSHGDYQDMMTAYYNAERIQAYAEVYSDIEDPNDKWIRIAFFYKDKPYNTDGNTITSGVPGSEDAYDLDSTNAEMDALIANPNVGQIEIVFWPEELDTPNFEPMSVAWIESQKPYFQYLYMGAIICLVIFFLIGLRGMLKRKKLYEKGEETWAELTGSISFNGDSNKYSAPIRYTAGGSERYRSISWSESNSPYTDDETGRILGLVVPGNPKAFTPISRKDFAAFK